MLVGCRSLVLVIILAVLAVVSCRSGPGDGVGAALPAGARLKDGVYEGKSALFPSIFRSCRTRRQGARAKMRKAVRNML